MSNPFWVLELPPDATAVEVERQAQKLLAMLGVGLEAAGHYPTPDGPAPRTVDDVRQALEALRDPDRRAAWEVFARVDPSTPPPAHGVGSRPAPWPDALTALGWR